MQTIEQVFLVLAYFTAIGFLINGLDDLFFDSNFLSYLWRNRTKPNVALKDLKLAPEQWIALFVSAWQEGGVVNQMANYAARVVMYEKYDIFIGVYPNDPETIACVDKLCAANPRIHKVLVPHSGPTSKADCLNWIYRAMRLNEVPGVREYKVIALHEAEDIIHPLVLKVYNYHVPRQYDMAQVPVFALELPALKYWTGNSCVDDSAEWHTKDLFVRQNLGGIVPSTGIGTAFARQVLDRLAANNNGEPFVVGNLTEDYEVGIRVKRAGFRTGVVSCPVDRVVCRKRPDGTQGPPETITEIVAIRESVPNTFAAAVRQRSRRMLGISFQSWEQAGWGGTLAERYTLLRDRRAPLTHLLNMLGYGLLLYVVAQGLFRLTPWATNFYWRSPLDYDSLLWKIIIVDSWLLAYRIIQKIISVQAIYNLKQALFSVPRGVVGNFINFMATMRAARMYFAHKILGKPIVWLKTAHAFPGEADLHEYTRTIEDLLVESGMATHEQIERAIQSEQGASAPLCLLRLGLLEERHFTSIWARHSGLNVEFIDPHGIPEKLFRLMPEAQSLHLDAVPVGERHGKVVMAFCEPPSKEQLVQLNQQFGVAVQPVLARPSNLTFARDRAYPRLVLPPSRLVEATERLHRVAIVENQTFLEALSSQHTTRRSLPDVLVDMGMVTEPQARRVWSEIVGCAPVDSKECSLNQELYLHFGPVFWWVHRLLPITWDIIATAVPPHPAMTDWLARKMGAQAEFVADLPGHVELAAHTFGANVDPDQMLIDCLAAKGQLKAGDVAKLKAMRSLIADPVPGWLRLQNLASVEQVHEAFLEICQLPHASPWKIEEVRRLWPVLPPGFAEDHGCYCLEETGGAIRLGLAQMPSVKMMRELHDRLSGYALCFQSLSFQETVALQQIAADADLMTGEATIREAC